ncbi:MAG: meta-pathway of phenol degradation [Candidatus Abyssobacteria bacterium SURF_5]|uniref:Meta-pathway of phenol degradation n=1 Tax=Abyssobacteria bacterium (strain SURF_5) TaxID=2093360 RepID=A0A3A4NBK6_ABYX5|nr:MAG: meta-pathway of phenol degradation [Candidatus Abyssubacteria bacterium SURF_5]
MEKILVQLVLKSFVLLSLSVALAFCLPLGATPVDAADHYNLEEGLPAQVVDSLPTSYRNREIQGAFRWDHTHAGGEEFRPEVRFEYGFALNAQAELTVPFQFGEAVEDDGIGDIEVGALYNFNQESLVIPGISVSGHVEFPTSDDGKGVDTTLKFIATKTIGATATFQRVHFNAAWKHNDEDRNDEREDRYVAIIGYDRALTADLLLVVDLVREQAMEDDEESNIFETGVRYQVTPLTVLAAGVGFGFGDESPDARIVVGFQHSF